MTLDVPVLSVIVASFSGEAALARCLTSLEAGANDAEVIVVTNETPEAVSRLRTIYPRVRFCVHTEVVSVFRLRSFGVPMARGRIVALLEDHCTVDEQWSTAILAAHQPGARIVGGTIDNGLTRGIYNWALYLCEYSEYMPPRQEGTATALLGPNVSYERDALQKCQPVWMETFYDNEVNDALHRIGHELYLAPNANVNSHLKMSLPAAMAHLYSGGRRFGGYRRSQSTGLKRIFWVLASPLIPLVWFVRIAKRVASRRRERFRTLLLALPFIACLLLAWAAGEAVGYLMSPFVDNARSETRIV